MDDRRLPFTEHLRELRKRLRNAILALFVGCAICFYWADKLYQLLARPLLIAWHIEHPNLPLNLNFGSLTEPFWVQFELSMYAGVFVASPFIFHQFWRFVAPGLYDKEKRVAVPFAICSALMFIGGGLFCYFFVFPAAFKFFLSYSTTSAQKVGEAFGLTAGSNIGISPVLMMEPYKDLTVKMLLGFGLVFELPLLVFFLSYVGLVTHRKLWKFNKYWVVLSFIIGGVLTPGPDVISQFMMAMPLVVLYNISILVAYIVTKRREKRIAEFNADLKSE